MQHSFHICVILNTILTVFLWTINVDTLKSKIEIKRGDTPKVFSWLVSVVLALIVGVGTRISGGKRMIGVLILTSLAITNLLLAHLWATTIGAKTFFLLATIVAIFFSGLVFWVKSKKWRRRPDSNR